MEASFLVGKKVDLIFLVNLVFVGGVLSANDGKQHGSPALSQPAFDHQLVVKFQDSIRARARVGKVQSTSKSSDLFCQQIADIHNARFVQLVDLDDATIRRFETKAFLNSGRKQPDFAAMMIIDAPKTNLQNIADAMQSSKFVDWVAFEMLHPKPPATIPRDGDIPPTTPAYQLFQGYRDANPGLNVNAFWAAHDSRGVGIKFADCEYWFGENHEDICGVIPEPGQTPTQGVFDFDFHQHGTASLGIVMGGDNEFGILGLAPDVEPYFFPEWTNEQGFRRVTAIIRAGLEMDPGDIILLEMQDSIGLDFGPAELSQPVWNAVRAAVDAGVVVVAAAGNGDQNLDSGNYIEYRSRGDSGSIIVGAGTANTGHNKLSFSTFGSRVDVQAWGEFVHTAGYGDFAAIGADPNQVYTAFFGGTSSASALIAGVCSCLQSYAEAELGRRLNPRELRQILRETGWPQGSGGNIGRFPNLVEAGQEVLNLAQTNDQFFNRLEIANFPADVSGTNIGATVEDIEPDLNSSFGATVWWGFFAEETGRISVSLEGSDFDTKLDVYNVNQSNDLTGLTLVAFNDDADSDATHSEVSFPVEAGKQYAIRVAGPLLNGTTPITGQISMNLEFFPAGPVDFFWSKQSLGFQPVNSSNAQESFVTGSTGSAYLYFAPSMMEIDYGAFIDVATSIENVIEFTGAETFNFDVLVGDTIIGPRWTDEFGTTGAVSENFIDELGAKNALSGFGMVEQTTGPTFLDQGYHLEAEGFQFARIDFNVVGEPGSFVNITTVPGARRIINSGEEVQPDIGSFTITVVDENSQVGDINCDGNIDLLDVQPFVDLLVSGEFSSKADLNDDGAINLLDVGPFVELLAGG